MDHQKSNLIWVDNGLVWLDPMSRPAIVRMHEDWILAMFTSMSSLLVFYETSSIVRYQMIMARILSGWERSGLGDWRLSTEVLTPPTRTPRDTATRLQELISWIRPQAVKASRCYFFENWLMKLKWANPLNTLGTIFVDPSTPQSYLLLFTIVYNRNHYFGLGPIPKPKLANTFGPMW